MKMKLLAALLLSSVMVQANNTDKMVEAIRRVDPDYLNQLLIPGFFIRPEEKTRYLAKAQEMTNRTFNELQSFSLGDCIRFVSGSVKSGLGALCVGLAYGCYNGLLDVSRWKWEGEPAQRRIVTQDFLATDANYQKGAAGVLGVLSLYLLNNGWTDFSDITSKKSRLLRHRNALAVEAVIQRLPVCESDGECESSLMR